MGNFAYQGIFFQIPLKEQNHTALQAYGNSLYNSTVIIPALFEKVLFLEIRENLTGFQIKVPRIMKTWTNLGSIRKV